MRAVGIIPARMASSRYPGKPLAPIAGQPMLQHCYEGAAASELLDEVVIATCDAEIADWAEGIGIRAVMTSNLHQRATDRVAEAAALLEANVFVLIQGDEPLVNATMISQATQPILDGVAGITNLAARIRVRDEFENPATIKIVKDRAGRALYMSRSPIPSLEIQAFEEIVVWKQICIFGFSPERLREYPDLEPTPLEIAESVDMNRYLEHGIPLHLVPTEERTHAVDVPEDVEIVERMLAERAR